MSQSALATKYSKSLDTQSEFDPPSNDAVFSLGQRPRLHGVLNYYADQIVCVKDGVAYPLHDLPIPLNQLAQVFGRLDGTLTIQSLQDMFFREQPDLVLQLLQTLDQFGLIDLTGDMRLKQSILSLLGQLQGTMDDIQDLLPSESILARSQQLSILKGSILQYLHLAELQAEYLYPLLTLSGNPALLQLLKQVYTRTLQPSTAIQTCLSAFDFHPDTIRKQVPLPYTAAIQNYLIYSSSTDLTQGLLNLVLWQNFMTQSLQQYHNIFTELRLVDKNEGLTQLIEDISVLGDLEGILPDLESVTDEKLAALRGRGHVLLEMFKQLNGSALDYYSQRSIDARDMSLIFEGGMVQ